MGFVLDGLDKEAYDREYSDRELVRRISAYFRPYARTMMTVALMIVLASSVDMGIPILISRGIDALVTPSGDLPTTAVLLVFGGLVLVLSCLSWVFNYVRQSYSARAVGDVVLALRQDAFKAITNRDLSFYDQFPSGKIVSRTLPARFCWW
jgi:ATP-binding cassette, subfamily B, bacterial